MTRSIRSSARSMISAASSKPATSSTWRWRSTSRSSARPTIPWLTEHPEWFKRRPDGSIQYAENPPKKYEDIVNPDFYCADRIALWQALRDVVLFWVEQGVRIFRVDNPHTKPFPFWEWLIHEVQTRDPERHLPVGSVLAPQDHEGRWPSSASRSPTPISPGARTKASCRNT